MAEKKYIEVGALLKSLCDNNPAAMEDYYYHAIKCAPTADVVEVVRCKDCEFRYTKECPQFILPLDDNGFCSNGERKEK